jgi:hypothetical protein
MSEMQQNREERVWKIRVLLREHSFNPGYYYANFFMGEVWSSGPKFTRPLYSGFRSEIPLALFSVFRRPVH